VFGDLFGRPQYRHPVQRERIGQLRGRLRGGRGIDPGIQRMSTLHDWLASDDPVLRELAAHRLGVSSPEADGTHPAPTTRDRPDPDTLRILACPDYNPGCCASPAPFCSRFLVNPTREQCIMCLNDTERGDL
jgi:hypothetical protein